MLRKRDYNKVLICSLLCFLTAIGCVGSASSRSRSAETRFSGTVIKVADGDTITVTAGRKTEIRVRLDGIDCPELHQAYGTKARQYASARVYGRDVTVVAHGKDDYGRTLGTVFVENSSLNEELVSLGLAWAYVYHSTKYASVEKDARSRRIGLWSDANPVPPWEFRNRRKWRSIQPAAPAQKAVSGASVVYATRNGNRYHRKGCKSLSNGGTALSVTDAKERGLTRCKLCKP